MRDSILLRPWSTCLAAVIAWTVLGCERSRPVPSQPEAITNEAGIQSSMTGDLFLDQVVSNRPEDDGINDLTFINTNGRTVRIGDFNGVHNVVLVFMRGFYGQLCPYCTTQTSRLIANYDKFTSRDTEILLVYPGSRDELPDFLQAGLSDTEQDRFPFPVLMDPDLAAVNQLGIASQLALPSTFILDKEGKVRFSYVGTHPADRPSIKAMLDQLDRLQDSG